MSLFDGNGSGLSAADVAAVTGNNGFGMNGDGAWWLIVLFLFAMGNNGWGNGFGGNNSFYPYQSDLQRGFDQQSVMSGINGITSALASAEVSRCNSQTNILQALNNIGMAQQNCCCENRAQVADLKYTIATEACADRQAVTDALRDVIANQTASTQASLDKMCQQEIDALKQQNASLQTQLNLAALQGSQTAQTAQILADNAAQTATLRQALNPTPIPAYVVQNPSCCNSQSFGCGCGNF